MRLPKITIFTKMPVLLEIGKNAKNAKMANFGLFLKIGKNAKNAKMAKIPQNGKIPKNGVFREIPQN